MRPGKSRLIAYAAPEQQRPRLVIYWAGWVMIGSMLAGVVLAARDWVRP